MQPTTEHAVRAFAVPRTTRLDRAPSTLCPIRQRGEQQCEQAHHRGGLSTANSS